VHATQPDFCVTQLKTLKKRVCPTLCKRWDTPALLLQRENSALRFKLDADSSESLSRNGKKNYAFAGSNFAQINQPMTKPNIYPTSYHTNKKV